MATTGTTTEEKTLEGGCHCGAVRFSTTISLDKVMQCNCSHCGIKGFLLAFGSPNQFTLTQGENSLTSYHFNKHAIDHYFCKVCGVQSYAKGKMRNGTPMVMVNVRALKGVEPSELPNIQQVDGRTF